jgi:hypothetical protein
MSIDHGPKDVNSAASRETPEGGFLRLLRLLSLVAVAAGAAGSFWLMLRAGQRTPPFLLILFTLWVLSPFAALLWANMVSKRWSPATRATLYCVTLVLGLGSPVVYSGLIALRPAGSGNAFLFVAVPPASWVFMVIVVPMAAFIARRRTRRGPGA